MILHVVQGVILAGCGLVLLGRLGSFKLALVALCSAFGMLMGGLLPPRIGVLFMLGTVVAFMVARTLEEFAREGAWSFDDELDAANAAVERERRGGGNWALAVRPDEVAHVAILLRDGRVISHGGSETLPREG